MALIALSHREALQLRFDSFDEFVNGGHLLVSTAKSVIVHIKWKHVAAPYKPRKGAAAKPIEFDDTPVLTITSNGVPLAEVASAKYLGLCFEGVNTTQYRIHLASTEKKARGMAQCALALQHQNGLMPVFQAILFYTERIKSIMLFASAVTFAVPAPDFEMLENTFMRRIVGVPDTASVHGIYLELGMFPIQMHRLENALKFYSYAASSTAPRLLRDALLDNMSIQVRGTSQSPTWFASLVHQYEAYGIVAPPHLSGTLAIDLETPQGRQLRTSMLRDLRASATQRLHAGVVGSVRFVHLAHPLVIHRLQPYLVHNSFQNRNAMTRVRLSNHALALQTGCQHRPKPVPRPRRTCRLCTSLEIEYTPHAIARCTGTQNLVLLRRTLLLELAALPGSSAELQDVQLLLRVNGPSNLWDRLLNATEKSIVILVAPFLRKCLREFYTKSPRYLSFDPSTKTAAEISVLSLFERFLFQNPGAATNVQPCDGFVDNDDDDSGSNSDRAE